MAARPLAAGAVAGDRAELDGDAAALQMRGGGLESGRPSGKQRSLLPGRDRVGATGSGAAPGPWTLSCCSPERVHVARAARDDFGADHVAVEGVERSQSEIAMTVWSKDAHRLRVTGPGRSREDS